MRHPVMKPRGDGQSMGLLSGDHLSMTPRPASAGPESPAGSSPYSPILLDPARAPVFLGDQGCFEAHLSVSVSGSIGFEGFLCSAGPEISWVSLLTASLKASGEDRQLLLLWHLRGFHWLHSEGKNRKVSRKRERKQGGKNLLSTELIGIIHREVVAIVIN